jgi:AbrB family looped-hinge helix DNA binding protein
MKLAEIAILSCILSKISNHLSESIFFFPLQTIGPSVQNKERTLMKATGIVRRIDDLGRMVIPKEIRRTMRIREGDPLLTILTPEERALEYISRLGDRLFG